MSAHVQVTIPIAESPERVWRLITDARELMRWFSEYADVSLEEKRYDFWGRFTPQNPSREEGDRPLLEATPPRTLRFHWKTGGRDTAVEITLTPDPSGTLLSLIHDGLPDRAPQAMSYTDFWSIALENLRGYAEKRRIGTRRDYAQPAAGAATVTVEVAAPKGAVFRALIEPAELNRYIADRATVEPNVGGRYDFGWGEGPIRILEIEPDHKLAYSWKYGSEPETTVTWTLEGSGGSTRLTMVHGGFGTRPLEDYMTGWLSLNNRLKFMVEGGPAWKRPTFSATDYAEAVS